MRFSDSERFDFPDYIEYVTAGAGGDTLLVFGSEKTALHDCGMAFCAKEAIANIERALKKHGRDTLDYILLSHSHYDHIGALPYLKKRWPNAIICGAQKAKDVFERPNALKLMEKLGTEARDIFSDSKEPILAEGFVVDRVVSEGDRIELGDEYFYVIETKGHTDCSLTYVLEPYSIMFLSESTGVLGNEGIIDTTILKSYRQSMESVEKCKNYGAKRLISPHFGIVPEYFNDEYWKLFKKLAEEKKALFCALMKKGMTEEEMLKIFDKEYWNERLEQGQPKAAFLINGKAFIDMIIKEFGSECGYFPKK